MKTKLNPNLYKLAAEFIESGECFGVYYALTRAAYRLNDFQMPDLIPYVTAWKKEHELIPSKDLICNDRGFTQQKKVASLLRMVVIAEINEDG